jgi:PKD repeat protein
MSVTAHPTVLCRLVATALGVGLWMLMLGAVPALAAPDPSFTVSPDPPVSGQSATYTSTSTTDTGFTVTKVEWDFDNDGTFDVTDDAAPWTAAHTYATAGAKTFGMRVTDNDPLLPLGTTEPQTVTVAQANRAPTALFAFSPPSPLIGEDVLFASNASDPDGDALTHLWTFGDGVTSPLRNPSHAFSTPGTKTVTLKVTDPSGASNTTTHQVVVQSPPVASTPANKPPVANFAFGPNSPQVGSSVDFVSSAVDPDGELRSQSWDLDGDGQFDDARGDEVLYTFVTPGTHTVRLRVEDNDGAAAVHERTVTVRKAPVAKAGFLTPAPVIRLNGQLLSNGSRITILSVRAPKGTLVTVRCHGKSCPVPHRRKRVKAGSVRFKTYERFLRAGVKLEILSSKAHKIGAYTRYTIRAGKSPARTDRCLKPGRNKPSRHCS